MHLTDLADLIEAVNDHYKARNRAIQHARDQ